MKPSLWYTSFRNYINVSSRNKYIVVVCIIGFGLTACFSPLLSVFGSDYESYQSYRSRLEFANAFDYSAIGDTSFFYLPRGLDTHFSSKILYVSDVRQISADYANELFANYDRERQLYKSESSDLYSYLRLLRLEDMERAIMGRDFKFHLDAMKEQAHINILKRYTLIATIIAMFYLSLSACVFLSSEYIRILRIGDFITPPRKRTQFSLVLSVTLGILVLCCALSLLSYALIHNKGDTLVGVFVNTSLLASVVVYTILLKKYADIRRRVSNDPEVSAHSVYRLAKQNARELEALISLQINSEEIKKSKLVTYQNVLRDMSKDDPQIQKEEFEIERIEDSISSYKEDEIFCKTSANNIQLYKKNTDTLLEEINQQRANYHILLTNEANPSTLSSCATSINTKRDELTKLMLQARDALENINKYKDKYIGLYEKRLKQKYMGLRISRYKKSS